MSTEIIVNNDIVTINVTEETCVIEAPSGAYPLPTGVYSVYGRTGNVVAQDGDYTLTLLGDVTITTPVSGQVLKFNGTTWVNVTLNEANWNAAYNDKINSAAVTGTTTKTLTLNQQDGGTITASWSDYDTAPVTSVFGRTGDILAQSGDYNTLQVTENTNLYFTDQRARFAISGDSASGVVYQNTTGVIALDDIPNTSLLNPSVSLNGYTLALGGSLSLTTTDIAEGTNLYYTDARARAAISGTAPISVTAGVVSISQSGPTTNGYLSSADWNTFNAKQIALTFGNLTSSDISVTGGTGAVIGSGASMTLATVNSNVGTFGSSTAIPVITVNGKGLVTSITTDAVFIPSGALSFIGDVTGTGNTGTNTTLTLATVNSNVGAYGDSVNVPTLTVNAKGLVTAASQTAIPTASNSTTGLLTSTDWATFNAKQAQLNGTGFVKVSGTTVSYDNSTYLTTIEGIVAGGELSGTYASPSLVNSAVTGKILTGLNVTGGSIANTDSILTAFGKVQNQINGILSGSAYQGTWNASTNTPTLTSGVGSVGYYYIVNVAGSTNLDGITDWNVGDWAIFDGTAWQQVDNTDAVISVNGYIGAVSLTTSDINEGTNQYFTTSRARTSLSAGTGISYDNSTGIITNSAPDQTVSLTASTGISTSGTYPNFTITNTAPDQTVSLTGSTGISTSGTYPNFTITNTAPDQVVSLTGAGTTSITGTYPNFTVTSNDQFVGTVTSIGITESSAALTITGSPVTTSGNINIAFAGNNTQYVAGDGSLITFPAATTEAENLIAEVYNNTGATLTKGTIVYINGGQGNLPTVTKAIASGDFTSASTFGIIQTDLTNMNNGFVIVFGSLYDLDTQLYAAGTQLYLSGTVAGTWTNVKPYAPLHLVYVGVVTRSHPTQGVVEVRIQNGYELDELHNVSAQSPSNGDILQYVSATSLWTKTAGTTTNIAEGTNLYYTNTRSRAAISLTTTGSSGASTYDNLTGILNVPTYTLAGLGGINLTSLSATSPLLYNNTTGVFSIQQSSGSQAGFLSAADWTTFNNKVPTSRTLTINGTTYDLSADRSWTISPNINATNTQDYTATASQTVFTVTGGYTVGQLAVFYNGSKLAASEYSAINGTSFTLVTPCQVNDILQAVVSVTGGGIGGSGTANYIAKWTASGVLNNSSIQDTGSLITLGSALQGTSATFSGLTVNSGNAVLNTYFKTGTSSGWDVKTYFTGGNIGSEAFLYLGYAGGETDTFIQRGSNGRLDLGTSSTARLSIASTGAATFSSSVTATNGIFSGELYNTTTGAYFISNAIGNTSYPIYGFYNNTGLGMYRPSADVLGFVTSSTERMRITSGGSVQIGTTSVNLARLNVIAATASQGIRIDADASYNAINIGGTGNFAIDYPGIANGRFLVDNSGNTYNRTGVYGTVSSDLRLKENIVEASSKLNDILKLRVVNFNLISDTEKKKNIGFIAQELQEVFPSLVYEADTRQYDEDGNVISGLEDALGIKVGMEFAILVKAIQELNAKIEELRKV